MICPGPTLAEVRRWASVLINETLIGRVSFLRIASNWKKFAEKYVKEASASTDRSLATGLYVSAAESSAVHS